MDPAHQACHLRQRARADGRCKWQDRDEAYSRKVQLYVEKAHKARESLGSTPAPAPRHRPVRLPCPARHPPPTSHLLTARPVCRRSGPQGSVQPFTIIDSPADWTSASLKGREAEYTLALSAADTAELIRAVDAIKARGVSSEEDIKRVWPQLAAEPAYSA